MSKLIVHNFGPLKDVEINTDKSIYMIGESASGKSTIAKLIYFFESDYYLTDCPVNEFTDVVSSDFAVMFDCKFQNGWVKYYFSESKYFTVHISHGEVKTDMSDALRYSLMLKHTPNEDDRDMFYLSEPPCFVTSGRSAISMFPQGNFSETDMATGFFYEDVRAIRHIFNRPLEEVLAFNGNHIKLNKQSMQRLVDLSRKVLNGEYRYEDKCDRIYYDNDKYINLVNASSSQQDVVWIVQSLLWMAYSTLSTLIIEEPESHLHPKAQYYLMQMIQMVANIPGNKVIVSTHSPYILSCLNNLLYAHNVGQRNPDEINKIIDKDCWADINTIDAYNLENGRVEGIIHKELGVVNEEILDGISKVMNFEYNKILELDE